MTATATMLDLAPAAAEIRRLVARIDDHDLDNLTPSDCSVATLLDHLLGVTFAFRLGAQKAADAASGGPDLDGARLAPDWRQRLPRQLDELVDAWSAASAWEGETTVGGVTMPAAVMGRVALDELVIHGWDLARGTRQAFRCDPASAREVLAFTQATAEPGREAEREGLFGPVVEVPAAAPVLHRALGFAGRDPRWSLDQHR